MEMAKEAVALDPTEADHKAALGKAFSALKLRKLATAEFEKAVALTPREPHDPFLRCHGAVSIRCLNMKRDALTIMMRCDDVTSRSHLKCCAGTVVKRFGRAVQGIPQHTSTWAKP